MKTDKQLLDEQHREMETMRQEWDRVVGEDGTDYARILRWADGLTYLARTAQDPAMQTAIWAEVAELEAEWQDGAA